MRTLHYLLALAFLLSACGDNKDKTLPEGQSASGELLVVADSTFLKKGTREVLQTYFSAVQPGLPQEEKLFTIRFVQPDQFNDFLKKFRNIIFVSTLNDNSLGGQKIREYYTDETKKIIASDTTKFMVLKKDEFAKQQYILHLFGQNENILNRNIKNNKDLLLSIFQKAERDRVIEKVKKSQQVQLSERIRKEYGFDIIIPSSFKVATERPGFVWYRNPGAEVDRNYFVSYIPYKQMSQFSSDKIIAYRDSLCKSFIYGREDSNSYMLTEQYILPVQKEINFNDGYAVEIRGLWKLKNNTMGGPFVGYALADTVKSRFYYIESFLYSPGQEKRENLREMEAIEWTFKP